MIDKSKIRDIYNESLNNSKQEYESTLLNKLENYIKDKKYFTIDELCKVFNNDNKYSYNYIRKTIEKALGNFYVGINKIQGDTKIFKYQNKFVQTIFKNFDFKYKPEELIGYEECYDYANDDIFSKYILDLYDEGLRYKDRMEKKIDNELTKSAESLNKTCIIDLFKMLPAKVTKSDAYSIAVYNYIFRTILNESGILFEAIDINWGIYKYKIIGFI